MVALCLCLISLFVNTEHHMHFFHFLVFCLQLSILNSCIAVVYTGTDRQQAVSVL